MSRTAPNDRLVDLAIDRALVGLDRTDDDELGQLLVDFPEPELVRDLEIAAAAIALANVGTIAPLPEHLVNRIEGDSYDGIPTTVHKMPPMVAAAIAAAKQRADEQEAAEAAEAAEKTAPPTKVSPAATAAAAELLGDEARQTMRPKMVRPASGTGPAAAPQRLPSERSLPAQAQTPAPEPVADRTLPPQAQSPATSTAQIPAARFPQPGARPFSPNVGPVASGKPPPALQMTAPHRALPAPTSQPKLPPATAAAAPPAPAVSVTPRGHAAPVPPPPIAPAPAPPPAPAAAPRPGRAGAILGWTVAVLALGAAAATYWYRPRTRVVTVETPARVLPVASSTPTPSAARDELLAKTGTLRVEATRGRDSAGQKATADVAWNAADQQGFLRVRGLARSDRRSNAYQIWVTDRLREERYPVDAGLFDVEDDTAEIVVPIKPKLVVTEATLFTVTVEKANGAVVSKRDRIVLLAKPGS